jgi:hypothetical protein
MHFTNKTKFKGFGHGSFHITYFVLSDNLLTLYEVCEKCGYAITKNLRPVKNIERLICKSRRDYETECCSCTTVMECRAKHNCCCRVILDDEIEKKRIEDKEREAILLVHKDPELAEMICKTKADKNV